MAASQATASELAGPYAAHSVEEIRALRQHPQFPEALRLVAAGLVDIYDGNRLLNQVLNDRGRQVLGFMVLYLHFSARADGLPGGVTVSRLTAMCAKTEVCSPGRAAAMLALMRFGGYLQLAAGGTDRRAKMLVPTDHMIAVIRKRLACQFGAVALLLPEGNDALARLPDIDFLAALSRRLGERFLAGARLLSHDAPELRLFLERNAGLMVVLSLFLAGKPDDTFPPAKPVRISISGLSRRFSVSRPHMMNLLRDAEQDGFLRRDGLQGEEIIVLPLLSDAVQNLFATVFLFLATSAREALAELAHDPIPSERVAVEL